MSEADGKQYEAYRAAVKSETRQLRAVLEVLETALNARPFVLPDLRYVTLMFFPLHENVSVRAKIVDLRGRSVF